MYCKKCGRQLREGAAFCGNCGTPTGMKEVALGNPVDSKSNKAERNGKKRGKNKLPGIMLLCFIFLLAVSGGAFFMYKFNDDKSKVAVAEKELDYEAEERDGEDEKEEQEAEETEAAEIQQEEVMAEGMPEMEPVSHEDDENGIHTYELIIDDVTWTGAYYDCIARGGYLVRINSEEEYQMILQQIDEEEKGNIMFWIGGARSAADVYKYRWIYEDGTYGNTVLNQDEPFLAYWLSGEPSFFDESILQDEMYMNMFYVSKEERWVWNDVPNDLIAVAEFYSGKVGYICEYED